MCGGAQVTAKEGETVQEELKVNFSINGTLWAYYLDNFTSEFVLWTILASKSTHFIRHWVLLWFKN